MKKVKMLTFVVVTVLFLVGFLLTSDFLFNVFGYCPEGEGYIFGSESRCFNHLGDSIGQPLLMLSLSLMIITFILLFLRPEIFKTWSKFAMVAIPLGAILIALTPVQSSSGVIAGLGIGEDRESVTWAVSILFLLISLTIIVIKSIKLRKK